MLQIVEAQEAAYEKTQNTGDGPEVRDRPVHQLYDALVHIDLGESPREHTEAGPQQALRKYREEEPGEEAKEEGPEGCQGGRSGGPKEK
ncbi:hypothetical protein CYMTET_10854 [Cymbomonas tetramitiformis]|uniref:Uncharacterized protein n=1 Tax=Cymbomonas tetramitiformis TaxID=36881 RepID=A0AAE0GNK4_9CHLO|nr:hypothetical protein CYMTET_10854 [Cymbomonas tetramitiformis]|eukprot:gene21707-26107_t